MRTKLLSLPLTLLALAVVLPHGGCATAFEDQGSGGTAALQFSLESSGPSDAIVVPLAPEVRAALGADLKQPIRVGGAATSDPVQLFAGNALAIETAGGQVTAEPAGYGLVLSGFSPLGATAVTWSSDYFRVEVTIAGGAVSLDLEGDVGSDTRRRILGNFVVRLIRDGNPFPAEIETERGDYHRSTSDRCEIYDRAAEQITPEHIDSISWGTCYPLMYEWCFDYHNGSSILATMCASALSSACLIVQVANFFGDAYQAVKDRLFQQKVECEQG